ncbi:MAG TPA: ATP-binding cassette domain-containing protein [Solirubrobacteraceae bacterium]|jgi:ABC-type branched-subunit amino acid transport system ATPase component|nr:ATP-binding cassette domain-containing protein [Solirubrobacteraceae bacterium]
MSNLIEVTGVSKSYGGVHALSLCDLQVREGEINGLIGPNGSGKTTLFNVITGYERIQQGQVHFNGTEITNAPPDRVFKLGIGRTFQLTRMFARLTVLENMLVATQRREGWLRGVMRLAGSASERKRAMELLDFVGITHLAHEPAGNLSFGQRKLLELASLLVADPAILLLDEPAGGVNPTLIGHLADRITDLNRAGKTILVVEHNMEFVMGLCSRITVLSQGRALISGTPAEVRTDPAVLDAYLGGEDDPETQRELAEDARQHEHSGVSVTPVRTPPRERLGDDRSLLSLKGVTAGYGGGDILKQVTLDVPRGGITCVVGPNGAGKSTLMATISGLLRPREGEIRFAGDLVSGHTPKQILARGIAQIPQAHSLFGDMTVRENVEMGAFTVKDAAVVRARLKAVEELYPIVRDRAGEKAGSLSGGQQRLVEFARCLMLDPELIMLDEPSMGLDPQTRHMVFDMIELMNSQGKTILLVEQNARAGLKLSSHGVVLENGMIRLTGSGREVLEHPEIGALYLGGAVAAEGAAT